LQALFATRSSIERKRLQTCFEREGIGASTALQRAGAATIEALRPDAPGDPGQTPAAYGFFPGTQIRLPLLTLEGDYYSRIFCGEVQLSRGRMARQSKGYVDVSLRQSSASTILVVEDEDVIRLNTCEFLRESGWTVLEADRASAAIAVLESGEPVDLVFSDIQMPGDMNGIGLAHWLRQNRPDVRVLLTSGGIHSVDPSVSDEPLIAKPYIPESLVERIRRHLRRAGTLSPRYTVRPAPPASNPPESPRLASASANTPPTTISSAQGEDRVGGAGASSIPLSSWRRIYRGCAPGSPCCLRRGVENSAYTAPGGGWIAGPMTPVNCRANSSPPAASVTDRRQSGSFQNSAARSRISSPASDTALRFAVSRSGSSYPSSSGSETPSSTLK